MLADTGEFLAEQKKGLAKLIELQSDIFTAALTDAAAQLQRIADTASVRDLARDQAEVLQSTRQRIVDDIARDDEPEGGGARKCELVRRHFATRLPSIGRVRQAASPQLDFAPGIQVEHVCLESDEVVFDGRCRGTPVGPSLTIASPLRGCMTELTVLDGHRLAVRTQRPQRPERQYVVDLRFIDGEPVTRRFIAWRWWLASAALAALAGACYQLAEAPAVAPWLQMALPASIVSLVAAVCIGMLALHRTHETIQFQSIHGRAVLVEITGSPGCARAAAAFAPEIARRIADARVRVAQSKQRFLCDELHEHRRLFEDGVLSEDVYEAGKRRILRAHD